MGLFNKKNDGGFMDVIRCDEPDYLIWKWHPAGTIAGQSKRENAIRWGSSLRVKEGSVAAFVYGQYQGAQQDYIEGPFDKIIDTNNLPILAGLIGLAYQGDTPFQAEVYFINVAGIVQVKFGVPFFDVFDPRFADYAVPVAVRGTISFCVEDYRNFVRLHRLENFDVDDFQKQIRDAVNKYVKGVVSNAPEDYNIPVLQLEKKILQINELIEECLKPRLQNDFGVHVTGVDISAIEIDKGSEGYRQLKAVTQEVTTAMVQAQTEVNIKNMQDMQRIHSENMQESLRIQREEAQYAQHIQTQSTNITAHQINQQAAVGIAGAEGLGQMGQNGGMSMDGGGMNPAGLMTGMMLGGVIGQNLASTMGHAIGGLNQQAGAVAPPPMITASYYVAINDQPTGAYDMATLKRMAESGQLSRESMVWKQGMTEWESAGSIAELQALFVGIPPEIKA